MLSHNVRVALTAGYLVLTFAWGALGYAWEHGLEPSLPLIPALCGAASMGCCGAFLYIASGFGKGR